MLKILPIIPSSTSQQIYPLFLFYSQCSDSHICMYIFYTVATLYFLYPIFC